MPPPFGPFAGQKHRGPPPIVVQFLRFPLMITTIVAGSLTYTTHQNRVLEILGSRHFEPSEHEHRPKHGQHGRHHGRHGPCHRLPLDPVFALLTFLFLANMVHNILTFARFHRLRRSVFGESFWASRRRWRQKGYVMDEEEKKAYWVKFRELMGKTPSLWISSMDLMLAVMFLGTWGLTTLVAAREEKVSLGFGYASVGALAAFIFNFIIGLNGIKFWARQRRAQRDEAVETRMPVYEADVKEKLLEA